jgi:hypothetical protein
MKKRPNNSYYELATKKHETDAEGASSVDPYIHNDSSPSIEGDSQIFDI